MYIEFFQIRVLIDPGKEMRMPHNKRVFEVPWCHTAKIIETYPLGHFKIPIMDRTCEMCMLIRAILQFYKGNVTIESKICSYIFPLNCAFDMFSLSQRNVPFRISITNDN